MIRPTLFIALGGTGMEIAHRVRRRILAHAWGGIQPVMLTDLVREFPWAQFIYFDRDTGYGQGSRGQQQPLSDLARFRESEMLCKKVDIGKYFRTDEELDRYPHIAEWLPLTRRKAFELGIDWGKWMPTRWMSRFYFFDRYRELREIIRDRFDFLHDITIWANMKRYTTQLGLEIDQRSLRVVIIASAAGGMGSGAFLDMGYLAKYLAKQAELESSKVDLCLMLPCGFGDSGHGKVRSEAYTYAALMELETCMQNGNQFVKGWSPEEYLELPQRPYDDVFLFDTSNLVQRTAKTSDLFDMVADIIFDELVHAEETEYAEYISVRKVFREEHKQYKCPYHLPVDQEKYGSMKMSYSKEYSSFGQSVIDLQLEKLTDGKAYEANKENPLFWALAEMDEPKRKLLFQNCLEMAMPWVDADPNVFFTVHSYQFTCLIVVNDAMIFEKKFGYEFRSVVPSLTGMTPDRIKFVESREPGKLTCYVELTGIPLTALIKLPSWRASYEEENKRMPVHIHKDRTLFVHPLAPNAAILDLLAEHFKLFIQGIVLGVLKLRVDDPKERLYCFSNTGKEYSIGNERLVRLEGLTDDCAELLRSQIKKVLKHLETPAQYAGMVALYDFYAQAVYPPATSRHIDAFLCDVEGFAHVMCATLCGEARKKLSELTVGDATDLVSRVTEKLDFWTDEIKGSEIDVYENEVDKSHVPKRILKREFFQEGWLEQRIGMVPPEPPPLPEIPVYIAVNGQQTGPFDINTLQQMAQLGQLTHDSLVWMQGMDNWAAASTVPYIINALNEVPSLDDGPPQID